MTDPHGGGLPIPDPGREPFAQPLGDVEVSARGFGRAMAWAAGSQLTQQLIQLPVMIVLSRLLVPRDFGLMAMVLVISQFLVVFVDAGLGAALVHIEPLEQRHISTAFWLNLYAGVLLAGVVAAASPGIAALYQAPRLTMLTIAVALNFVLASVGIVPIALLQRQLRFRQIAKIQNSAAVVGGASGVVAAVLGAGLWSLVIDLLTTSLVQTLLATGWGRWRAVGGFDRAAVRELWSFGRGQTGFQALNYWSRSADNLLIGKVIGARALGLYGRAYQLMLLPLSQAGFVVSFVLYPTLARIQHDHERLKRAYLRTVGVTALLTFPVTVGLFVLSHDLIVVLFGTRWLGAVRVLRILCLAGLLQSVDTTTGVLYQAVGRTDWLFRWGMATAPLVVVAFIVGVHWGVDGVAIAYSGLAVPLAYFTFAIPGRLIGMVVAEVVRAVAPPLVCACLMGVVIWLVSQVLAHDLAPAARLAIGVLTGAVVYLLSVRLGRLRAYRDVLVVLKREGE